MTAFPLSFVSILSRGPFSINVEVFSFSLNCSYAVPALFFSGASWDAEDRIILGYISRPFRLSLYVLGYIPFRLGPCALKQSGPGSQVLWPHTYSYIRYNLNPTLYILKPSGTYFMSPQSLHALVHSPNTPKPRQFNFHLFLLYFYFILFYNQS